eukprot:gene46012-57364_t
MDIAGSLSPDECLDEMGLDRIRDKAWHITPSNAITGAGVNEGIDWLCDRLAGARPH